MRRPKNAIDVKAVTVRNCARKTKVTVQVVARDHDGLASITLDREVGDKTSTRTVYKARPSQKRPKLSKRFGDRITLTNPDDVVSLKVTMTDKKGNTLLRYIKATVDPVACTVDFRQSNKPITNWPVIPPTPPTPPEKDAPIVEVTYSGRKCDTELPELVATYKLSDASGIESGTFEFNVRYMPVTDLVGSKSGEKVVEGEISIPIPDSLFDDDVIDGGYFLVFVEVFDTHGNRSRDGGGIMSFDPKACTAAIIT